MSTIIPFTPDENAEIGAMNLHQLEAYLRNLETLLRDLDRREPRDEESEEYQEWAEEHEDLEDLMDEVLDQIDELRG